MKKFKKFLFTVFYIIMILFVTTIVTKSMIQIFDTTVYADVGSFESYGGGGGGGSSDSSYSHSSGSSSSNETLFIIGVFIAGFILFLIMGEIFIRQEKKKEIEIEKMIKIDDPNFSKEEFAKWSNELFITLQQTWTKRDWEPIRTFETESLFEQHKNQLQGYIDNNQINIMDNIDVFRQVLTEYKVEGDKEILKMNLASSMEDYIIDATTKEVIKGEKGKTHYNHYTLTFIRKNGIKTKPGTIELNTTNCPNCGAPTQITSSGKCEYCGSVITTGEYNWVLSNLERQ